MTKSEAKSLDFTFDFEVLSLPFFWQSFPQNFSSSFSAANFNFHNLKVFSSISFVSCLCLHFESTRKKSGKLFVGRGVGGVTLCYAQWIAFRVHLVELYSCVFENEALRVGSKIVLHTPSTVFTMTTTSTQKASLFCRSLISLHKQFFFCLTFFVRLVPCCH